MNELSTSKVGRKTEEEKINLKVEINKVDDNRRSRRATQHKLLSWKSLSMFYHLWKKKISQQSNRGSKNKACEPWGRGGGGGVCVTKAAARIESPDKSFGYRVGDLDKVDDISRKLEIAKTNQDLYHNNERKSG